MKELVVLENDQAVTTSLQIAENFEKRHADVIRAIEDKIHSTQNSVQYKGMFKEDVYRDSSGKQNKMFYLNRDGFTFIAMGFTGAKADEFKLKYIEAFNQMEQQLQEIYHISETVLTNNVMKELKENLFHEIDERFEMYEKNYRPTHANKIRINKYIKERLGSEQEENEAELVKQRVLLMLNAEHWQDVPYKELIENIYLIDQSIETVKGSRVRKQLELFNDFV